MIDISYSVAGAITGFIVGLTGVGGGALMTPILLLFFGVSPVTAIATDLWFAAITKIAAARIHGGAKQIDWSIVKRLWLGSLPMALLTVIVVSLGTQMHKVGWLTHAIAIVLFLTAIGLILAPRLLRSAQEQRLSVPAHFKKMQPIMTVAAGLILGLCVALTSIGAGALGSVMLLYLYPLRMTPHRLVATDIVHAIPLAIIAGTGYLIAGMVDWHMLLSLLTGSIPAVILGSLLAQKISARWVQIALAFVLTMAAAKVIL